MKLKRMLGALLSAAVLITGIPYTAPVADAAPSNLVPTSAPKTTANYTCTWNIQDWVAYHEGSDKRDVVDPEHLFNEKTGWVTTLYPEGRSDMLFLLDDGWDLPYGTKKNGKNKEYFGCQVLPDDKFPKNEWGNTPQEKLKTLNEKIKAEGWAGTGIWICAQRSTAYSEYAGKNEEEFWRMRLQWSKYAGIAYWKIDWGTHQRDLEWRRNISEWAEEEYPELIIEHIRGGEGINKNNGRMPENYVTDSVEYGAFSDVFRTYDVLDPLMTVLTLDRVGEQLIGAYTEEGPAMGLMNAEDELYICASLGLTTGVMRFDPNVTTDSKKSGAEYFGKGTEKNTYYAGGKKFVDTRATRNSLDEVTRMLRWQRIAPAYEMGAYDTKLSNEYLQDEWTFSKEEPAWDGKTNQQKMKAPAVIARGIDLPTVKVSKGDVPFLTAARNPNGAISIATHCRVNSNTGYTKNETAEVSLNAGDLTGKIGVFGYYGKLNLTFNQNLSGKKVYAQDLLANKVQEITSQVKINGKTLTIEGSLLKEIGLSSATKGDTSEPGLVIQIGEESDFVKAPKTNERIEKWDVNNRSFENFHYDGNNKQTIQSVTAADWSRSDDTSASYINEEGHTGKYSGIHKASKDYKVTTYQLNQSVPDGTYKASCWVKASKFTRSGSGRDTSAGFYVTNCGSTEYVDIQKMGELKDWTYIEIPKFSVTSGQIQVEFFTYGKANEYLMFDDVKIERLGESTDTGEADAILHFDFSNHASNNSTVTGIANGKAVTANAQNVTFSTDAEGNDVAVFPNGGSNPSTGITYTPGDEDPMKTLKDGAGVTIAMWVKTGQNDFSSSLFSYGSRQNGGSGDLGASLQIVGRNNKSGDTVFYRNSSGSSGGQKVASVGSPYKKDTWQLVTFVERGDGGGVLYIDGVELGTCDPKDKSLKGFATDGDKPDVYYFGFLPYEVDGDAHFVGSIDSITVYNKAMSKAQIQALYDDRKADKTEITLKAMGEGILDGQAKLEDGYVGWIGGTGGSEGTVTFNFKVEEAGKYNVDIYYLSEAERSFTVTVNNDTPNAKTVACPAGNSWSDTSLTSVATLKDVSLQKGMNTLKFGNPNGDAPSLVKVVVMSAEIAAAKEVEELILSELGTVDDFAQLSMVQNIRAKYDALSDAGKKLISEEAYNMLISAEKFMQGFLDQQDQAAADKVIQTINDLGANPTKDQVTAARAEYNALTDAQKKLIAADVLKKLTDAEEKLNIGETETPPTETEQKPTETEQKPTETEQKPTESESESETDEKGNPINPIPPQTESEQKPSESEQKPSESETKPNESQKPSETNGPGQNIVLTPEETQFVNKLGVSKETAQKISALAAQQNISQDTLLVTDASIKALKNDKDVKGSTFTLFQARASKQTKNSVKLKWNKLANADGYAIYGNKCGKKYEYIGEVSGKTSYTQKGLKKGTYYKYIVRAYKVVDGTKVTIAASKTIHAVTKGGKYGVATKVTVKKSNVKLNRGKSFKLNAKEVNKNQKIKKHRSLKYESTNTKVAKVSGKGKITAVGKGTCQVYVYAQNGVYKKVKVTVK